MLCNKSFECECFYSLSLNLPVNWYFITSVAGTVNNWIWCAFWSFTDQCQQLLRPNQSKSINRQSDFCIENELQYWQMHVCYRGQLQLLHGVITDKINRHETSCHNTCFIHIHMIMKSILPHLLQICTLCTLTWSLVAAGTMKNKQMEEKRCGIWHYYIFF